MSVRRRTGWAFGLLLGTLGGTGGCGGGGGGEGAGDGPLASHRYSGITSAQFDPAVFFFASTFMSIAGTATGGPLVGVFVGPGNQGSSVFIGPEDDEEFDALASLLTNGADDGLRFSAASPQFPTLSQSFPESGAWLALAGDVVDPDMAGYTITRIEIRVTTLSFSPPGPAGITHRFNVTFVLHGRPD